MAIESWRSCHRGACRSRGTCILVVECNRVLPIDERARDMSERLRAADNDEAASVIEDLMRALKLANNGGYR